MEPQEQTGGAQAQAEAQAKAVEEAIRTASAKAEEMARAMVADLLGGRMDVGQVLGALQGMAGRVPGAQDAPSPYRVLGLDPSAEDDLVKLVYRYHSRRNHPDRGGSPERMAEINRAYEAIRRERGWGNNG